MESTCFRPMPWPFLWIRINWVVNISELCWMLFEIFNASFESSQILCDLTDCAPSLFAYPAQLFRNRFRRITPSSSNHQKSELITLDFFLRQHDFSTHQERENKFIFFKQTSTQWFIEINLEFIDDISASVFLSRNRLFDGSLIKVYVEL